MLMQTQRLRPLHRLPGRRPPLLLRRKLSPGAPFPAITRQAPSRRGSQETPYRFARRCSTLAPYPWAAAESTAPANVSSAIQEARAALRFLKDVEQDVLVQAMREELSNSNLCYFQHCFATMWDDSHDESSESDLDVPGFPPQHVAEPAGVPATTTESQTAVPAEAGRACCRYQL